MFKLYEVNQNLKHMNNGDFPENPTKLHLKQNNIDLLFINHESSH